MGRPLEKADFWDSTCSRNSCNVLLRRLTASYQKAALPNSTPGLCFFRVAPSTEGLDAAAAATARADEDGEGAYYKGLPQLLLNGFSTCPKSSGLASPRPIEGRWCSTGLFVDRSVEVVLADRESEALRLCKPVPSCISEQDPLLFPFEVLRKWDMCSAIGGGRLDELECPINSTRLVLFGIPRKISEARIETALSEMFASHSQWLNKDIRALRLKLLFGSEKFAVNPLSSYPKPLGGNGSGPNASLSGVSLVAAEFQSPEAATWFWALSRAGFFRFHGHCVSAAPDPSGYRAFGEAVAANFRPVDVDRIRPSSCPCLCSTARQGGGASKDGATNDSVEREFSKPQSQPVYSATRGGTPPPTLFLPFITFEFYRDVIANIPLGSQHPRNSDNNIWIHHQYIRDAQGCLLTFRNAADQERCCLSLKYQFSLPPLDLPAASGSGDGNGPPPASPSHIRSGFFYLQSKLTPCVFNPPSIPILYSSSGGMGASSERDGSARMYRASGASDPIGVKFEDFPAQTGPTPAPIARMGETTAMAPVTTEPAAVAPTVDTPRVKRNRPGDLQPPGGARPVVVAAKKRVRKLVSPHPQPQQQQQHLSGSQLILVGGGTEQQRPLLPRNRPAHQRGGGANLAPSSLDNIGLSTTSLSNAAGVQDRGTCSRRDLSPAGYHSIGDAVKSTRGGSSSNIANSQQIPDVPKKVRPNPSSGQPTGTGLTAAPTTSFREQHTPTRSTTGRAGNLSAWKSGGAPAAMDEAESFATASAARPGNALSSDVASNALVLRGAPQIACALPAPAVTETADVQSSSGHVARELHLGESSAGGAQASNALVVPAVAGRPSAKPQTRRSSNRAYAEAGARQPRRRGTKDQQAAD